MTNKLRKVVDVAQVLVDRAHVDGHPGAISVNKELPEDLFALRKALHELSEAVLRVAGFEVYEKTLEFDPTAEDMWFIKSPDNWIIEDAQGRPYVKCLFAGKVYRLYLVEDKLSLFRRIGGRIWKAMRRPR